MRGPGDDEDELEESNAEADDPTFGNDGVIIYINDEGEERTCCPD